MREKERKGGGEEAKGVVLGGGMKVGDMVVLLRIMKNSIKGPSHENKS